MANPFPGLTLLFCKLVWPYFIRLIGLVLLFRQLGLTSLY